MTACLNHPSSSSHMEHLNISNDDRLSNAQRSQIVQDFHRDGFAILPTSLNPALYQECLEAVDRLGQLSPTQSSKCNNCVDADPAFRKLMMWKPALQLVYDLIGPSPQLNQSNAIYRPRDNGPTDSINGIGWHADGPRPQFPTIDGVMGLYYLKFAYFLTDLQHETGGSLEVVRGSHRRPELDGKGADFDIRDYEKDHVKFHLPANSVAIFHQALWHSAPTNQSDIIRKNCYYSYSPTWMRPFDRSPISEQDAQHLDPVEAFLLGVTRPSTKYWMPDEQLKSLMKPYARN